MTYVSINRVSVKQGSGTHVEQLVGRLFPAWREWQAQGELRSTQVVRAEDGTEYALVSVWESKEAHDRHEAEPIVAEVLQELAAHLAGSPNEFTGTVVAALE